ncbi:YfjI family protein [Halomonas salifodinae]|uniref:YfjI family protein n=1 Tax=Halomonas salifodinae TaxID=438745 RepID=A0ABW2F244_9GAMM
MSSNEQNPFYQNEEISSQEALEVEVPREWPRFREYSLFESTTAELSYSMEVAEEMAKLAVLGVMATACQGLFDVAYPNSKIKVPMSLMTCTVAGSSERKTTLKKWTDRPITEFEIAQAEKRKQQAVEAHRLHQNWQIKIRALEKSLSKEMANDADPEKITSIESQILELQAAEPETHKNIRIIYKNATPGALALSLYENFPCAFLSSSESGNLLNGPTFRDMYIFNSIYSGSTITIDRSSQPSFILHEPRLSICLMLQPAAMDRFLEKKGREAHDNGFLSRFLFIKPEGMAGNRTNERPPIADHVEQDFYSRVTELLSKSLASFENGESRRVQMFSSTAKALWKTLFNSIECQIREGGIYHYSKEHASKLMENITRVAGIIHAFEGYEGDISSHTLEYAYKFCRKCSQHYLQHLAEEPEIVTLTNLMVQDIRRLATPYYDGYRFKKSLIQQRGSGKLRNLKSRKLALDTLEKLGHLRVPIHPSGDYEFKNTVWTTLDPELKNGEEFTIAELPLWREQELVNPFGQGKYLELVNTSPDARHY